MASQIAAASLASFLFRFTSTVTYCGGTSRTSCPSACSSRAQWCDDPHASSPTTVGASAAKNSSTLLRRSLLRRTGSPAAFTPCSTKTLLDVSTPIRISWFTDGSLGLRSSTTSFWHSDAVGGRPPQQRQSRKLWLDSGFAPADTQ